MSGCSPIKAHTIRSHQFSGRVENNSGAIACDVIAAIEKLNDEQWMTITGGMSNIARLDFAEICICIILNVSKSARKMLIPVVQILDVSATHMAESQQSLNSPGTAVSTDSLLKKSPLDIPLVRALWVQILQEVRGACLVAIERIAQSRPFVGSGHVWKAQCFRLEEETLKVFFKRLDELDLFTQKPDASSFLNKKERMDLEVTDLKQETSQKVSLKATIAASDIAKELDVGEAVARLEDFINSGEIHKFSLDLTAQVLHLLKKSTCQRVSLPVNQKVSDTDLQSPQRGNNEIDSSSVSLEFAYMFVEDSVTCFLHQLLFPSCPSKVSDPDDFIQSTWSSNPCMAMAAHESCSGNTICSSHALRETVDLLRDIIVNQVMGSFSPEPAFPCTSNSEDAAGPTSCFETTDDPNSMSTTENKRKRSKKSWTQKLCILPKMKIPKKRIYKKYFSRRNAVSPLAPNQACRLDIDTAGGNHLLENLTFTPSVVTISEQHASMSQPMENVHASDTAAKKSKKRNIFTKFFLSITESLQTCFKK